MQLKTTEDQLRHVAEVIDEARKSSETVKVSREVLFNLMADHGAMSARLKA